MAGPVHASDQAARDDAHLQSLGIKPELRRTLGFLSNFAIAFAFISVSTGSFGNFGGGIALGGPAMFWTWFVICGGQFLVALVFAELASHLPGRRLRLPMVEATVEPDARLVHRLVLLLGPGRHRQCGRRHRRLRRRAVSRPHWCCTTDAATFLDSPSPGGFTSMFIVRRDRRPWSITTIINAYGVRLLSILNNIGVATEILGMLVFASRPAVLRQRPAASRPDLLRRRRGRPERQHPGHVRCSACSWPCSSSTASIRPGRIGEETARRRPTGAPRRPVVDPRSRSLVGADLHPRGDPRRRRTSARDGRGRWPAASRSGRHHRCLQPGDHLSGSPSASIYLVVILASVFVCTMAIQGAATRLMFSMGRDRHLPARAVSGPREPAVPDPRQCAVTVGVIAALPILVVGPVPAISLSIAATGLIYVSYFLCNAGVMGARRRGWPHKPAWFSLGRWGTLINILALLWGGLMIINIALWTRHGPVRRLRGDRRRALLEPVHQHLHQAVRPGDRRLPAWPLFETLVGTDPRRSASIYYLAVGPRAGPRRRVADIVTGEAVIG